jgi:hypothetical protein
MLAVHTLGPDMGEGDFYCCRDVDVACASNVVKSNTCKWSASARQSYSRVILIFDLPHCNETVRRSEDQDKKKVKKDVGRPWHPCSPEMMPSITLASVRVASWSACLIWPSHSLSLGARRSLPLRSCERCASLRVRADAFSVAAADVTNLLEFDLHDLLSGAPLYSWVVDPCCQHL